MPGGIFLLTKKQFYCTSAYAKAIIIAKNMLNLKNFFYEYY